MENQGSLIQLLIVFFAFFICLCFINIVKINEHKNESVKETAKAAKLTVFNAVGAVFCILMLFIFCK